MTQSQLADFIRNNLDAILQAWEDFARTIEPPALTMDDTALRDHAQLMLLAFATDLERPQTDEERDAKSRGLGKRGHGETAAEAHAEARLLSGYNIVQLTSEYRALRSSVLSLWSEEMRGNQGGNMDDMTRFNEAVDQALAESVARYEVMVKQSQNMFLAILGHDLRNPLGTLMTGAGVIMRAIDIPSKYVLVATRMHNSAKRMNKLIDDLIDFTRTHLGPGIPIQARQCDLVAVCEQVVDELRTSHPEQLIDLEVPSWLDADVDDSRIAQVLSNLIGNAVQYGGMDAPVTVRLSGDEDEVSISVNNRGAPIPSNKLSSIFDPLVRIATKANHAQTERTSLGIGLFVSREIVQAHGGRIAVASNAEDGTTFTVTLPRRSGKPLLKDDGAGPRTFSPPGPILRD